MQNDSEQLAKVRHTLAHLMARAIESELPGTFFAIGPDTENGFYYDVQFPQGKSLGEDDFPRIEKHMRDGVQTGFTPEQKTISHEEAKELFKNQPYKLELVEEIVKNGEEISIYTILGFVDLCEGPHVADAQEIDPEGFSLSHVAGAYWKGDENNPMLTRIYGLAFENKNALSEYKTMLEEAKKRDHRKLGKELDLFTISPLVGSGLPLWSPRGTHLRHTLDEFVWELREKHGYQRVTIPHITKKDLYETSGHWQKFGDELFRVTSREGKEYALKPMNCPHHTQIFARMPHSYKDMPQRYAETTMVYRDEQSGELGGLTRVLSITQDDSHVFCRHNQLKEEFFKIWDIVETLYSAFNFSLQVRLSFHGPEEFDKYLGTPEIWKEAEDALRTLAKERGAKSFEAPGEAALYGPKLDFMATDSIGREHQVATIQLDLNLPERFDLTCINEHGEKERIVMIHAAIMGSLERFSAVLIEHLGGAFPLWLAPEGVRVLPIGDSHRSYAHKVVEELRDVGIRAVIDDSGETLGKKIREGKTAKVPYLFVVGDKEIEAESVGVESRDAGALGLKKLTEVTETLAREQKERLLKPRWN